MRFETLSITPEMAAAFLQGNTDNRAIRRARVDFLAECLTRGEWKTTHQGVAISTSGRLLDGQHRLLAIIKAGIPAQMVVAFGAEEDTFSVLDQHEKRGLHDALTVRKDDAAIIKLVFSLMTTNYLTNTPSTGQARKVWEAIKPSVMTLHRGCSLSVRSRSAAPIRAAVLAHIINGNGEQAVDDYRAFVALDVANISPAAGSLLRQLDDRNVRVRSGGMELLLKSWVAFDPNRRTVMKVFLRDMEKSIVSIREAFAKVIQAEDLE